uniref:Uncharacterized protein n=1 Tax=viral metagenome TaxID=1070528 RepID=A0A6C0LMN2_9ZZZZ
MSDTTNINDLRTDPVGGNSHNISLNASETMVPSNDMGSPTQGINLDESTINQIINGIQQAGMSGATQLKSRDIPMNPSSVMNDPNVQPNYVPQPTNHEDYIEDSETTNDMLENYNRNLNRSSSIDDIYSAIQTPLLLSVLYFLFQLPFFQKHLYKSVPILFSSDGNYNFNGLVTKSILFGISYYILNNIMEIVNTF